MPVGGLSVWFLCETYPLAMTNSLPWKITMLLIGKPSINGSFSMAMLNNQRVNRVALQVQNVAHQADCRSPRASSGDMRNGIRSNDQKAVLKLLVKPGKSQLCIVEI